MAKTVGAAFKEFLSDIVNLDSDVTSKARSSRGWLVDQIHLFPSKSDKFPILYEEKDIFYGSFSRRTKIRELDDIDLMICINATHGTYIEYTDRITITVPKESRLKNYCHDDSYDLNSTKIINAFKKSLEDVPQYGSSTINRRGEAAVLKLKSYTWVFDIIPCFFTNEDSSGRTYYLMPDGKGHWKKTDPRIDQAKVTRVNQENEGNLLNVIRIIKYWNSLFYPKISSYALENLIINAYDNSGRVASEYVYKEVAYVLNYIYNNILYDISDPKNIQRNINDLSHKERLDVRARALTDSHSATLATIDFFENEHEKSINQWRKVFGSNFPEYK